MIDRLMTWRPVDRVLERAWRWLNPRWRACGGKQLRRPDDTTWSLCWRAFWYGWAGGIMCKLFIAIEGYHFDIDHPERWQK